jgi:two-component sensor histidine kinase/PAS domain-containing protein
MEPIVPASIDSIRGVRSAGRIINPNWKCEHHVGPWPSTTAGLSLFGTSDIGHAELTALALLSVSQILVTGLLLAIVNRWHKSKLVETHAIWWVVVALAAVGLAQVALSSARPDNAVMLFGTITALFASLGTLAAFPEFLPASVSAILPAVLTRREPDPEMERERHRVELSGAHADHAAKLAGVTQRFEPALQKSQIFVSTQDRDLRYVWAINPPPGVDVAAMIGKTDEDVMPQAADRFTRLKRAAIREGKSQHAEIEYETAAGTRWYDVSVDVSEDQTRDTAVTTIAVDLTERKRLEERLVRLTRDVTHRTKNVLAVVHAIARQTAARSPGEFIESFGNRVQSLARAHDLLVNRNWQGVDLEALINVQIADLSKALPTRVSMTGPVVTVGAEATQNIGLAIHELADNARKHGALTSDAATVSIDWHLTGDDGDPDRALRIRWLEQGLPIRDDKSGRKPVSGFGHAFLETAVGRTLAARAKLALLPGGLSYEIEIPAYHLEPS